MEAAQKIVGSAARSPPGVKASMSTPGGITRACDPQQSSRTASAAARDKATTASHDAAARASARRRSRLRSSHDGSGMPM